MKTIPLTQNRFAIVDDEDYDSVINSGIKWCLSVNHDCYYALGHKGTQRGISMHRLILDISGDERVDHIDCNGLNNTRANLRLATPAQNMYNRRMNKNNKTGYKGVRIDQGKYRADIRKDGKMKFLGFFDNLIDAAKAYDQAAIKLFGEFARTNGV